VWRNVVRNYLPYSTAFFSYSNIGAAAASTTTKRAHSEKGGGRDDGVCINVVNMWKKVCRPATFTDIDWKRIPLSPDN